MSRYYTVYDDNTEEIITSGSSIECAEALHITRESFYSFVSNTRSGRTKGFTVVVDDNNSAEEVDDNSYI